MLNSVISTRIPSLHGSQPLSVVLCIQKSDIRTRIACLYGSQTSLVCCACKTACLESELLVSMDSSPHLSFSDAKHRLLDQNNKSLWVPDITCRCVHANSVISTRITSLYGYQTSPVVLCMHNSVISTRITSLYGFQPSSVVLIIQNSDLRT